MNKKIYSLLVFVLGLFLHLYFQDEKMYWNTNPDSRIMFFYKIFEIKG